MVLNLGRLDNHIKAVDRDWYYLISAGKKRVQTT